MPRSFQFDEYKRQQLIQLAIINGERTKSLCWISKHSHPHFYRHLSFAHPKNQPQQLPWRSHQQDQQFLMCAQDTCCKQRGTVPTMRVKRNVFEKIMRMWLWFPYSPHYCPHHIVCWNGLCVLKLLLYCITLNLNSCFYVPNNHKFVLLWCDTVVYYIHINVFIG